MIVKNDNDGRQVKTFSDEGVSSSLNWATVTLQNFIQSCDKKTANRQNVQLN